MTTTLLHRSLLTVTAIRPSANSPLPAYEQTHKNLLTLSLLYLYSSILFHFEYTIKVVYEDHVRSSPSTGSEVWWRRQLIDQAQL